MTHPEAIKLFEQLIETNMAGGNIKNFATLDRLREGVKVMKEIEETRAAMQELLKKD